MNRWLGIAGGVVLALALFGIVAGCSKPKPKQFPTTSNLKCPPGIDNCIELSDDGAMTFENSHIERTPAPLVPTIKVTRTVESKGCPEGYELVYIGDAWGRSVIGTQLEACVSKEFIQELEK
jgi:hypothetical protein